MKQNALKLCCLVALAGLGVPVRGEPPPPADIKDNTLPTGAIARLGDARFMHGEKLQGLSLSPDGSVVLGADDRHIWLWDAETGRELREFKGIESVQCAALSPNGKTVAAVENGTRVWLWDTATGKELRRLTAGNSGRPDAMCWSPDGKWIVAAMGEVVYVWEAESGKQLHKLSHRSVTSLAVSPDRRLILTGSSWSKTFRLWDVETGKELRQFEGGSGTANVAFAPDGKTVVGYCEEQSGNVTRCSMRTWDVATGERLRRDFAGGWFALGGFAPDGKTVFAGNEEIRVWDTTTREVVRKWKVEDSVRHLSLSGDGKCLAGEIAGRIRIWDATTGKERHPPTGHTLGVSSVSFSPDGKTVASGSADHTLRIWDWTTGREVLKHHQETGYGIASLAYRSDGMVVFLDSLSTGGVWRVWDPTTRRTVAQVKGDDYAPGLPFGGQGKVAFSADLDGRIGIWDLNTGKELRRIETTAKPRGKDSLRIPWSISPSPDGRCVAWSTSGERAETGVVEVKTGRIINFKLPDSVLSYGEQIAYAPDGKWVATCSSYNHMRFWHPETGKQLAELEAVLGDVLAFSPDGRFVAVAGKEIAVWDLATKKELIRLKGHRHTINELAFEPRGRVLVSASADGTLLVWDLTGQMKAGKLANKKLTNQEFEAAWEALKSNDPQRAQHAVVALAGATPDSVSYIEKHLKPVAVTDPKRLAELVSILGAEEFIDREQASRELTALGEVAVPALQQGLKSDVPEVRNRSAALLRLLSQWELSAEQARALRAVAALEYAGGPDARRLLQRLAEGDPASRLTRSAKAALERVSRSEEVK